MTSRGRVARRCGAMASAHSPGRQIRPATTDSRHPLPIAPNLLEQDFSAEPHQPEVGRGYLLSVWTNEGWLYLAVILDLFELGGWSAGRSVSSLHKELRAGGAAQGSGDPEDLVRG